MNTAGAVDLSVAASPHEDGHWITDRVSRIVEIIRDYDPNLDVKWIPPNQRASNDPAFAITAKDIKGKEYIVFYVQNELEFDERVLARIFENDSTKNDLSLSAIDAHNNAIKTIAMKKQMEELEEAHDLAAHIWKSPKARYRHNGVVYE